MKPTNRVGLGMILLSIFVLVYLILIVSVGVKPGAFSFVVPFSIFNMLLFITGFGLLVF
jgi:hypothetical protein